MDTSRVDICYRPLRIAWAIRSGDAAAFRKAVQYSYALWGGRFNPIVFIDREEESRQLIELFRVDYIVPLSLGDDAQAFIKKFPHLINPNFHEGIFVGGGSERPRATVLDIHNALVHWRDRAEWKAFKEDGIVLYSWNKDDPLADVLMVQLGAYPDPAESGLDYRDLVAKATTATQHAILPDKPISASVAEHPHIGSVGRFGIRRHYSVHGGWDYAGFYVGNASSVDDLVLHWNLRACDIPLWFYDYRHKDRYTELFPKWQSVLSSITIPRFRGEHKLAIWTTHSPEEIREHIPNAPLMFVQMSAHIWSGRAVRPPMMILGEASALGVVADRDGPPRISFSLNEKPFASDSWFFSQNLVASVKISEALYGDEQNTFTIPYVPELNEFFAREMHGLSNKLHVEPERMGLVIDAADTDEHLIALPVATLVARLFELAGFDVRPSTGGRILRQLIQQLGGVQGARVFKIPGVRDLIKKHGPNDTFSANVAHQFIRGQYLPEKDKSFAAHKHLYIEPRERGAELTPAAVLKFLVGKGLFRLGFELECPNCGLPSWISLDNLKQQISCELCGHEHDVTRQIMDASLRYRRSGVLGAERNAQGAIGVSLTLQQLQANWHGVLDHAVYAPSLDVTPGNSKQDRCEIDFVWLTRGRFPEPTVIVLGECKDQGPIKPNEFSADVENLCRVADAFPRERFRAYILLSKLAPFTAEEIEIARRINGPYEHRAILVTPRELEPYHLTERIEEELGFKETIIDPEDTAQLTHRIYFAEPPRSTPN